MWIGLLTIALSTAATLAPALAATPSEPRGNLDMRVQLSDSVVLVSGRLSAGASLPATVALPVPSGVTPYWVGEILGGDPSADPTAQYVVTKAKGYDLIVFSLKRGRSGQVEYKIPALTAGIPVAVAYSLPVATKVTGATLSIAVPSGATVTSSTGGTLSGTSTTGQTLTRAVTDPKVGERLSASVSFTPAGASAPAATGSSAGTGAGPASAPSGTANGLALPLWILAFVLAGLFGYDVYRRRSASASVPAPSPAPARKPAASAKPPKVAEDAGKQEQEWSGFEADEAPAAPKARRTASAPRPRGPKKS
jgi:hypothetical protein